MDGELPGLFKMFGKYLYLLDQFSNFYCMGHMIIMVGNWEERAGCNNLTNEEIFCECYPARKFGSCYGCNAECKTRRHTPSVVRNENSSAIW